MKIVFMGTPEFAVPSLKSLYDHGYTVAAVVTRPDRPKGRGRKVISPPVKHTAVTLGYDILQPESIRTDRFEAQMKRIEPDVFVVVAFGHVLPKHILTIPKLGAINVHASLLPKYRGPAPVHHAVINGEKQTGITTMLMKEGVDTGDILLTETIDIRADDTAGTLLDRLSVIGADLLIKTLKGFETKTIRPMPQDHSAATYAPMLKKKDGCIDWDEPAEKIERLIRGMTPWPGAVTFYQNKRIRIFRAEIATMEASERPGTVIRGFADELRVASGNQALSVLELQEESGKRLPIGVFLRGKKIPIGARLG